MQQENIKKIGFCICGSFCTISKAIEQMQILKNSNYDILPIVSEIVFKTDTRFGKSKDIIKKIEDISQKDIIRTIKQAESIGPKNLTDIMLVAPCTGNTLSKLANAITDSVVTMAVKSHLRGQKPVLIALASNDALAASIKNLGILINRKNYFFVPMVQDDVEKKPTSLVADFEKIPIAVKSALRRKQTLPMFI